MAPSRLVIFDVDGTLVDSESEIAAAMARTYGALGLPTPPRSAIRSIIGLSLPLAFARLSPQAKPDRAQALDRGYRAAYADLRRQKGAAAGSPLFPGARQAMTQIAQDPEVVLGVATGKSRRGLSALIDGHGLQDVFATTQVADDHPSKPDPSMIFACMAQTGVAPENAVMVGDTSYDMDMARAAAVRSIAVGWGYHPVTELVADQTVAEFSDLPQAIDSLFGVTA